MPEKFARVPRIQRLPSHQPQRNKAESTQHIYLAKTRSSPRFGLRTGKPTGKKYTLYCTPIRKALGNFSIHKEYFVTRRGPCSWRQQTANKRRFATDRRADQRLNTRSKMGTRGYLGILRHHPIPGATVLDAGIHGAVLLYVADIIRYKGLGTGLAAGLQSTLFVERKSGPYNSHDEIPAAPKDAGSRLETHS